MNFREYKIGSRMFALALGGSMCITLLLPSLDIASVDATSISMDKQLTAGYETGLASTIPCFSATTSRLRFC